MLIEANDDDYDRIVHDVDMGNTGIFSLLTDDNDSNPDVTAGGAIKSKELGLLILEGEETYDDKKVGCEADKDFERDVANELSIPDTVLLPSDMRSVVTPGATSQEQSTGRAENVDEEDITCIIDSYRRSIQFWKCVTAMMMMMLVAAIISFGSLRNVSWKSEALQLREDSQHQQSFLPLTASLLMERRSLLNRIDLLDKSIHRERDWASRCEDMLFNSNTFEKEEDPLLSIKNCYVEASLSLGQCSKELQNWWLNSVSSSKQAGTGTDGQDMDVDGFTTDMAKLVDGVKSGFAVTTTQSYNFIEKVFMKFSYTGLKETFLTDDYIQSIVKPGVSIASALAIGMVIKNSVASDNEDNTSGADFMF